MSDTKWRDREDMGFGIGFRPFRWEWGHRAICTTHWLNFGPFFIQWKLRSW